MNVTPESVTELTPNQVFVFGSNLAGRHGKGAALWAMKKFDAVYGEGVGPTGRCYAIPTKDGNLKPIPLPAIGVFIHAFLKHAKANLDKQFLVTQVGCGLRGLSNEDVAPFFRNAPANVFLPKSFWKVLHAQK